MRISKPDIPIPDLGEALTNSTLWPFRYLLLAILLAMVGLTMTVGGLVLIPMMAFAGSVQAVVGASAMFAVGLVTVVGVYLYLTL